MSNCPQCGAPVAPNSRFCTECGRPLAVAGQAPTPPAPPVQPGMVPPPVPGMVPPPVPGAARPPMPPGVPGQPVMAPPPPGMMPPTPMSQMTGMPPAPPIQPSFRPPAPQMVAPQAPVAPPAYMPPAAPQVPQPPVAPAPAPASTDNIRMAAAGDLYNNGQPVAVIVTENRLVIVHNGGAMKVEEVPGVRHALVGDFDGDGTQDLALFSDTHVWLVRFGPMGSVPSGKVPVQAVPEHLAVAPFTSDGKSVLVSLTRERATFYVLHPSKGLVEISTTSLPLIEP